MVAMVLAWALIFAGCIMFMQATDCPDTWIAFQGSCYHFETEHKLDYIEAEHFCRQQHEAHLVHVDNSDENAFLRSFLRENKHYHSWMGLTDGQVEGLWVWYDDDTKAVFTGWAPGEPNDTGHAEDCAAFDAGKDYQWDDLPCSFLAQPVCEIRRGESPIVG